MLNVFLFFSFLFFLFFFTSLFFFFFFCCIFFFFFFFSSRRRHTRFDCDWSSDVCSSDLRRRVRLLGHQLQHGFRRVYPRAGRRGERPRGPCRGNPAGLSGTAVAHGEIGRASCRERV